MTSDRIEKSEGIVPEHMEYDKKQNLRDMLNQKPHPHIPVSFFQHFPVEDTKGRRCVDAHLQFARQTNFDFLKIMHDGLTAPVTLTPASFGELQEYRPLKQRNPYIREYLERAKGVNEGLCGELDTYCNVFSPMTLLRRIGEEKWKSFYKQNPTAMRDILLFMGEDIAYLCEKLLTEAGCMGIFLALQGAERGFLNPEEYLETVQESDKIVIQSAEAHSSYNMLHFCGWNGIPNQLELWREYPGNVVNWDTHVEKLSLSAGRSYFRMRNCFGGLDNRRGGILYAGTRKEVEAETIRILEDYKNTFGSTDGLMLGGDCSYLPDFETERFEWVIQTVRRWEGEQKNVSKDK